MLRNGSIIGGDETDELKQKAKDFLDQGNRKLILDLTHVTYLNSSGIGAVVSIHTAYVKSEGKIKVCGLGKGVQNVFVTYSSFSPESRNATRPKRSATPRPRCWCSN